MALMKRFSFSHARKRILVISSSEYECFLSMKKQNISNQSSSLLEALPQEILVKVVCGVDHDDLNQLFHVSRTVRDAAVMAKRMHFAYITPSKAKVMRNSMDNAMDLEQFEAPNAPRQDRRKNNRGRIEKRKMRDICVALFVDEEEHEEGKWPKRSLFV